MLDDDVFIEDFSSDDLPNDILKDIYQYWLVMKGECNMPSRANLHPTDIVSLLPYVSLIDVEHDTQRFKMRLVGTETVNALGKDITGSYLDEHPEMDLHLRERYERVVKNKRPYFVSGKLLWSRKTFLTFNSIGMPLSGNGRDVDIIMYGSYFQMPDNKSGKRPAGTD
ncbi:MAG: PAS domain-containing protein [Emcibacter sp.]|nr:PAS domain-containing protein [Emcibacter sp.]